MSAPAPIFVQSAPPPVVPLPAVPSPEFTIHAGALPAGFRPESPTISPRRPPTLGLRAASIAPALVAALAGAVLFSGLSGFGRDARIALPIRQQIDGLLVRAGLTINEIAVSGHRLTLDSDIYSALRVDAATSLLAFDVASAKQRIENIPWVADAEVARVLPDKLRISIKERTPAAVWQEAGAQTLVDASGRRLGRVAAGSPTKLPVVTGLGAPAAVGDLLKALSQHPDLAARIESAARIGQRRWTLALVDGTLIHLPETDAAAALDRLADLDRRSRITAAPGQIVDLRRLGQVAIGETRKRHAAEVIAPRRQLRAEAE